MNPLGTVVTLPNEEEFSGDEPLEDAVIHENCDESLFRPVVGIRPVVCLQPKMTPHEQKTKHDKYNKNQRYQGLKLEEIIHHVEQMTATDKTVKKNKKTKQKQEAKSNITPDMINTTNKLQEPVEQIEEPKGMWSSVEKLPEPAHIKDPVEPTKEMWSSLEHCKMEDSTYAEMTCNSYDMDDIPQPEMTEPTFSKTQKPDDYSNVNNNSSETTESDDSTKNRVVSVADEYTAEDTTATNTPAIATQSVKTSKKKAKKKRK